MFISFINFILYYQAKFMSMNNIAIARSVWPNYEQPFLFLCKSYCSNNNISLYYFFNMTPKGKVTGKDIVSLFTKD